jgi:hypothetical protein
MMQVHPPYATREQHARAWEALARDISALADFVKSAPESVAPGSRPGELVIIGSGIETLGFQIGDEALIRSADKVFYCVADPATVVWIKQLRPDAYDLYVLYDDNKVRYTTYMQMAEAQLYYVRQGLKVVVIFYGHPGVFVLATHRAVLIARREGHKATMKAGVCALDCLCADIGVDPSHPGMQTHEATDMLLRKRRPDLSLHVVLWQVGLIGEMGFRRNGFLNSNFSLFIAYLQQFYGHDYPVTHYIASRYPPIPPLIEVFPLEELHNPDVQVRITGISTFYLAPKEVTEADPEMAERLGLIKKGQTLRKPASPLREIGKYGPRELAAFTDFARFTVPSGYHWQEQNAASEFVLALRQDVELQELYARDPAAALADPRFVGLTEHDRRLLRTQDAGSLQIAAKGVFKRSSPNLPLIMDLLKQRHLALALLKRVRSPATTAKEEAEHWLKANAYHVEWSTICEDVGFVSRNYLFPWSGVYADVDRQTLITLIGNTRRNDKSILYVNDCRIRSFTFSKGNLQWKASRGNPHNGFLRFDMHKNGKRRLIGSIWPDTESIAARYNLSALEIDPQRADLRPLADSLFKSSALQSIAGNYVVRMANGKSYPQYDFVITDNSLSIDGRTVEKVSFKHGKLMWTNGPENAHEGVLTFVVDPITLTPEIFGTLRWRDSEGDKACYGSGLASIDASHDRPKLACPVWALEYLEDLIRHHRQQGGLFLWHQWEKYNLTSLIVDKVLVELS